MNTTHMGPLWVLLLIWPTSYGNLAGCRRGVVHAAQSAATLVATGHVAVRGTVLGTALLFGPQISGSR